jgi:hypothetical protein
MILLAILCCMVSSKSSSNNGSSIAASTSLGGAQEETEQKQKQQPLVSVAEGNLSRNRTTHVTDLMTESEGNGTTSRVDFGAVTSQLHNTNGKKSTKRKQFLNRIAMVSAILLRHEEATLVNEEEFSTDDEGKITPQSDLTRPGRHIHIVTTASLPWFTVRQQLLENPSFIHSFVNKVSHYFTL